MLKSVFLKAEPNRWQDVLLPLAAFAAAFLLRYHLLNAFRYPMMIHEQDAIGYMDVAKSILRLQIPGVTGRPPGYPVVIALFALLPVSLEYAARLASIFMDSLIVVPLYITARIYLSRSGAFAACLLWGCFAFSLCFSTSPLSQSSYLCYLLWGIALLHLGLEKRRAAYFLASGILLSFSYLARPEGIIGFGCGFLLCLTVFFEKGGFNRKNLLLSVCFLSGFLILAAPYLLALHSALGEWSLSPMTESHVKTADSILTLNSGGELSRTGSSGISVWKEQYGTIPVFLKAVRENMLEFAIVYSNTFPIWMYIVTGLGAAALVWMTHWRRLSFMLILCAVITPNFVVSVSRTHSYIYPVFIVTFICFAYCFETVTRICRRGAAKFLPALRPRSIEIAVSSVLLVTVLNVARHSYTIAVREYQSPQLVTEALTTMLLFKGAGEILKNSSSADDVIMTRWGLVGYFSERKTLALPKGGVADVIDYGRRHGARYLLIDTKSVQERRQELEELLSPLEGKRISPDYGIEIANVNYFTDIGGFVIYRYKQ